MIYKRIYLFLLPFIGLFNLNAQNYTLEKINISGNSRTKSEYIFWALTLKEGQVYSENQIKEECKNSHGRLLSTNLFNDVQLETEKKDSSFTLHLKLIERWYYWPIPFIELSDRNVNQWWDFNFDPKRTNYGMYLFLYNLRGRNETLKLTYGRGFTKIIGFNYRIPLLNFEKKWGIDISVFRRINREFSLRTFQDKQEFYSNFDQDLLTWWDSHLKLQHRKSQYHLQEIIFKHAHTTLNIDENMKELNKHFLFGEDKQNKYAISYTYQYEKTNNKYYPLEGAVYGGSFETALVNSIGLLESELYYKGYIPLGHWFFSHNYKGMVRWFNAKDYRINRALGYKQNIRGYELNVIDGNAYVLTKLQMRYELLKHKSYHFPMIPIKSYRVLPLGLYAGFFTDFGYVNSTQINQNKLNNTLLYSLGLSLDAIIFVDWVFRFEYSYNPHSQLNFALSFEQAF